MKSHELATRLKEAADYILSRSEFEVPRDNPWIHLGSYWMDKAGFLAAVKSLGAGSKKWSSTSLDYEVQHGARIQFDVSRSAICRKVQEERWECEPLLSPEEESSLGK